MKMMPFAELVGWKRARWMGLAAFSVGCAVIILVLAPVDEIVLRQTAQIQFMHGMATFACSTFMNIGAVRARHAPAWFLGGSALYCAPAYLALGGGPAIPAAVGYAGIGALIVGWLVLAHSASAIDMPGTTIDPAPLTRTDQLARATDERSSPS